MTKIWNSKIPGMNITAQATGGSAENVRLVNQGEAKLAIVQSDTLDFAFNAKETFKEKLTRMAALAVLYPEVVHVVVREESQINRFDQLKGKKIGVGAPGSGNEANFRQISEIHGLKIEDVKVQYLSFTQSVELFKDKQIDGFIATAGIPNTAVMDIASRHNIRIITIADDKAALIVKKYPFLRRFTLPAQTYKNQTSPVKTVAVSAVLIASADVKEDVAYNMVKILFESQNELAAGHAKGKELNLKAAASGVSIPFHPGAARFYKEKGLMK
jgi:TRAP transporter TAXI family solute receptor